MIPVSQMSWPGPRSASSAKISEQKRAKPRPPQPLPAASEMTLQAALASGLMRVARATWNATARAGDGDSTCRALG